MRVLLLEDDPALRFALAQALEDAGHNVHAAASILGAVEILEQEIPDLLLLDLMIGSEASIQIADLAAYRAPNAEVVYLTGSNRFPSGELFELSTNASLVLRKPIDVRHLQSYIGHLEATRHSAPTIAVS